MPAFCQELPAKFGSDKAEKAPIDARSRKTSVLLIFRSPRTSSLYNPSTISVILRRSTGGNFRKALEKIVRLACCSSAAIRFVVLFILGFQKLIKLWGYVLKILCPIRSNLEISQGFVCLTDKGFIR